MHPRLCGTGQRLNNLSGKILSLLEETHICRHYQPSWRICMIGCLTEGVEIEDYCPFIDHPETCSCFEEVAGIAPGVIGVR